MLTLWTLNDVYCVPFSCVDFFHIVHNLANLIKKILILSLQKHQTSVDLINVFDFIGWLSNYVVFDEIKWFCALTKYTAKIYNKATIHVNKLILTPFSPFGIKCKILNLIWKTSGNVLLGHLAGCVFHIFPRLRSIMSVCGEGGVGGGGGEWVSLILFRVYVGHVTIFS